MTQRAGHLPDLEETALGIELGSTTDQGVPVGPDNAPLASGSHDWENQLVDGLWTYSLDAVWSGVQESVAALLADVERAVRRAADHRRRDRRLGDDARLPRRSTTPDELLVPFRTWRNTTTGGAAAELTGLFGHNIPLRWSVAHLYQAILDEEPHVPEIASLTTLAGYVHWG